MIWLIALFALFQTAPVHERAPEDRLMIHYPGPRETVRCLRRLEDEAGVQVTVMCRVTDFGRATDCERQGGAELSRRQADAIQCMTRETRFTNGDGERPKPSSAEFTISISQDR